MQLFTKEGIYMNQRIINVYLTTLGEDQDVLRFSFSQNSYMDIDLDSATCQADIKKLFSELLQIAMTEDVKLNFASEEGFPRELYKDVCEAYIKDIERELTSSIEVIRQ